MRRGARRMDGAAGPVGSAAATGAGVNDANLITKTDKRFAWLEQRVISSFRVRSSDVMRAFDDDNMKRDIITFLDVEHCRSLTVRVTATNTVIFAFPNALGTVAHHSAPRRALLPRTPAPSSSNNSS
jgi:hypothetical protein